ncbi:MAG: protein kinase [Myxococcales bacterium]|nr:protein kinase [Myxococcales bacterium]MCB9533929.1 protein kinase [Myxococcales bacterium]
MRFCLDCSAEFDDAAQIRCTACGGPLIPKKVHDPLLGRVIGGRYELQERIGHGGFGSVYRAQHTTIDQRAAVKILKPDYSVDPQILQRFYAEAKVTSRLSHPHNVRIFDFGHTDDGLVFIVMEFVEGVPLSKLGKLPRARVIRILEQVAAALGEAHELGIVHRDLKPENVMIASVDGADYVRVVDYGIAKLEDTTGMTATGGFIGTVPYASPEQLGGDAIDRRSDIYSFGVMAFELLAGRRPFVSEDPISLAVAHRVDAPPPLASLTDVSPPLNALVMRCLAKKPPQRPASMAAVRETLLGVPERDVSVDLTRTVVSPPPASPDDGATETEVALGTTSGPLRTAPQVPSVAPPPPSTVRTALIGLSIGVALVVLLLVLGNLRRANGGADAVKPGAETPTAERGPNGQPEPPATASADEPGPAPAATVDTAPDADPADGSGGDPAPSDSVVAVAAGEGLVDGSAPTEPAAVPEGSDAEAADPAEASAPAQGTRPTPRRPTRSGSTEPARGSGAATTNPTGSTSTDSAADREALRRLLENR